MSYVYVNIMTDWFSHRYIQMALQEAHNETWDWPPCPVLLWLHISQIKHTFSLMAVSSGALPLHL